MTPSKAESSWHAEWAIDLISAVKQLNGRSSQELHDLLKEAEDFCICYNTENGLLAKIDAEKLAGCLPLHLIAVLIYSNKDEETFCYILAGVRLLNTLCDIAPRHTKLEQVLHDDVKISEQILDLVFYLLVILGGTRQASCGANGLSLLHAALVASSLYLLHSCITSQWQDLVQVLLSHPKIDIFMDAAFGSVHCVVKSIEMTMLSRGTNLLKKPGLCAERAASYLCLQAEASLQFLHSLCEQKQFRERLAQNKELCGNGGVLMLAQSTLLLPIPTHFAELLRVEASTSRMKSRVQSILLHLFEVENVSFLDDVVMAGNLELAKSIAAEVLESLRTTLPKNSRHYKAPSQTHPMGFVQLNAMRLTDIYTDDSNFRPFFTRYLSEVLSAIFSLSHGDFLHMWCSPDFPSLEEEASLEYNLFAASGWVLDLLSTPHQENSTEIEFNLIPNNLPKASYVHQRTSFLVKMIANLHCFIPDVCEEQERNRFFNNFTDDLRKDFSKILPGFSFVPGEQRIAAVCRNLQSLLNHADSLIPNFLNIEDMQLLRMFVAQVQSLTHSEIEESQILEAQSTEVCSTLDQRALQNLNNRNGNANEETSVNSGIQVENIAMQDLKEEKEITPSSKTSRENDPDARNVETSGSDSSSARGKKSVDQIDSGELPKANENIGVSGSREVREDEKAETNQVVEKQKRKRKRSIMNDEQMAMIERVLLDEPDMQRNSASIQTWSDRLCHYGPDVTSSQLRNWLNNRKAKLARANKQAGPARDKPSDLHYSPPEENVSPKPQTLKSSNQIAPRIITTGESSRSSGESIKPGQDAVLVDGK